MTTPANGEATAGKQVQQQNYQEFPRPLPIEPMEIGTHVVDSETERSLWFVPESRMR